MEQDNFQKDDFLGRIIRQSPPERPSDDFVMRVMEKIQVEAVAPAEKRPFLFYLKVAAPYVILTAACILILLTSDIPLFNWFPGKSYLYQNLLPSFDSLYLLLKKSFASRYISWGIMIGFSACLLYAADHFFSRRVSS